VILFVHPWAANTTHSLTLAYRAVLWLVTRTGENINLAWSPNGNEIAAGSNQVRLQHFNFAEQRPIVIGGLGYVLLDVLSSNTSLFLRFVNASGPDF
jgi:hypothetical protein